MPRWRFASPASGNTFADRFAAPSLHQSGFLFGSTREVNHTRPFSSIIGLWLRVRPSQIGFGPHTAEGPNGLSLEEGVSGLRTGCGTSAALFVFGSTTGTRSVLSSGEPYSLPFALTRGLRRSVET